MLTKDNVLRGPMASLNKLRDAIVLGSNKGQHKGAYALAEWEAFPEHAEASMLHAISRLQYSFHEVGTDDTAGVAKLLAVACSIGQNIWRLRGIRTEPTRDEWRLQPKVGGLYLEALAVNGFITLTRDSPLHLPGNNRNPWMIMATDKWLQLDSILLPHIISGGSKLTATKPAAISQLFDNDTGRPVIKRTYDESFFNEMLDTPFLKGLDGLQQTGWRINQAILGVVLNHPWDNTHPPIPKEGNSAVVAKLLKVLTAESRKHKKKKANRYDEAVAEYEEAAALWAVRHDALKTRSRVGERLMTIAKATSLEGADQFYNKLEADYRGRAYCAESFINYQGNDLSKGLLEFSEGVELTTSGLRRLLIHAACCFNQSYTKAEVAALEWPSVCYKTHLESIGLDDIAVDKLHLDDCAEWSKQNLEFITEVSRRGILHADAEKPTMFLAACNEIVNALEAINTGMPFISHLPIPIDGSNNGSQHCSAINKDEETANQVGMTDTALPVDLYMNVGKAMMEIAPEFFESRQIPMKVIRKNISKGAAMVRQYSAGAGSIATGMYNECHKNNATEEYGITANDCEMLAGVAIRAIDKVCPSNKQVREFLQACAKFELGVIKWYDEEGNDITSRRRTLSGRRKKLHTILKYDNPEADLKAEIAAELALIKTEWATFKCVLVIGSGSKTINWTAPSGFKVRSKLFNKEEIRTTITISKKKYKLVGQWVSPMPDISKHMSSISANYIHSNDAAHLAIVIAEWFDRGHTSFAAVHDSFAVHASNVDELLDVVKEKFVSIYDVDNYYKIITENILTDTEQFNVPFPKLGNYDFKQLAPARDFFR